MKETYLKNGVKHCAVCHAPVEKKQILLGETHMVPIMCECDKAEKAEWEEKTAAMQRTIQIERLKSDGLQDWVSRSYTFAEDDGNCPQMVIARNYVKEWDTVYRENYGLLIWGDVGTGKSFLAGCIANALIEQCIPVIMTSFPRVLKSLYTAEDKNAVLNRLSDCALLIIDDLGVERSSEYAMEQLYSVIDSRYRSKKPMIITTNLTLEEMKNPKDMEHLRIYDRILENCVPVRVTGKKRRQEIAEKKIRAAKELLTDTSKSAV